MSTVIPVTTHASGERWRDPTVTEVIEEYLAHGTGELLPDSRADMVRALRLFMQAHGAMRLSEARPYHLQVWVESRKELRSDWTKAKKIRSILRPFNWAAKLGLIAYNPFFGASHRVGKPGRPLTEDEWQAFLRHSSRLIKPLLIFLYFTGCRGGEARAAKWSNVELDLDAEIGLLKLETHKTSRRTGKPRLIAIVGPAFKLLLWLHRRLVPGQEYLFTNRKGEPWKRGAFNAQLRQLRKRAGLPRDARYHSIRHTFASNAILRRLEVRALAELLGHTTTKMAEHYVHVSGRLDYLADAALQAIGQPPADKRPPDVNRDR